jgi:hypothetical protein
MDNKDIMTVSEFIESIRIGTLHDDDGFGYFMKLRKGKKIKTSIQAVPSFINNGRIPPWATHVVWYNK